MPLVILASGNLWNGAAVNYSPAETACRIACMLCVGFLEEVIFRGLLFRAIARDNIKAAVIISSVTFGIGHIINLVNGSGMNLVNNLCQIVFAIIMLHLQILQEERYLADTFGVPYQEYCRHVFCYILSIQHRHSLCGIGF